MGPRSVVMATNNDATVCCLLCFFFLRYLNAIQTMCPHILRYLTTAVITNKDVRKRRQVLKDLVKVIQQVWSISIKRKFIFILPQRFSQCLNNVFLSPSCRSRTHTRIRSQSLWSVSTSTSTSTAPRRS